MKLELDNSLFTEEERENTPKRLKRFEKEWKNSSKFKFTIFPNLGYNQMIILKDIEFASLCAHHLLPFHGKACIGYIPDKKICGISKLARVLDKFAHTPQTQERLTEQVADFLDKNLKPLGVMVVLEAAHDCMRIRGVQKQNSVMITSALKGAFEYDTPRSEFLRLIK